MKKQVAAALSIAGVLVAGSAAAMVNSQVLSSNVASASAAPATTSTVPAGPSTTIATAPSTTLPSTSTTVVGDAAAAGLAAYQVGDAGTVTLDASGAELVVVSAVANPGWVTAEVDHEGDALRVKVEFVSATTKVEFRASSLFGVITTSVESTDLTAPAGTVGGHSSGTVADDHADDDGEYESEDHESEDHEDEHEAGDDD